MSTVSVYASLFLVLFHWDHGFLVLQDVFFCVCVLTITFVPISFICFAHSPKMYRGHMLRLTRNARCNDQTIQQLRDKTRELLSHKPVPSLLHGDLWGGNKGLCNVTVGDKGPKTKIVPVIFDPATYYGDREADVAMTYLFGGFSADFYKGYNWEWPLPEVGSCNYYISVFVCVFASPSLGFYKSFRPSVLCLMRTYRVTKNDERCTIFIIY